jgi:hypothetical protein
METRDTLRERLYRLEHQIGCLSDEVDSLLTQKYRLEDFRNETEAELAEIVALEEKEAEKWTCSNPNACPVRSMETLLCSHGTLEDMNHGRITPCGWLKLRTTE